MGLVTNEIKISHMMALTIPIQHDYDSVASELDSERVVPVI